MSATPIDTASSRMTRDPDNDACRLAFYESVAEAELYLLLDAEADGDRISPRIFETGDGPFVLAFDREDRLTAFANGPAPYAAMTGRSLVAMLAGQALGIGLNLGVEASETVIAPDTVDWLEATLQERPEEIEETPTEIHPPAGVPEGIITALDSKLATATGLAKTAYLSSVVWNSGQRGHLLAFVGTVPGAEDALARAINEALVFSGFEAAELDVTFLRDNDAMLASLARNGLRFDLPERAKPAPPSPPGLNPDRPPKLR